jgi:hypothetical protein
MKSKTGRLSHLYEKIDRDEHDDRVSLESHHQRSSLFAEALSGRRKPVLSSPSHAPVAIAGASVAPMPAASAPAFTGGPLQRDTFDQQLMMHQQEVDTQDALLEDMNSVVLRLSQMSQEMNVELDLQGKYVTLFHCAGALAVFINPMPPESCATCLCGDGHSSG